MSIFVAVVEQGSMAAAARVQGLSPATVTRAMTLLEGRLGERLLHRSARNLRLTESGERYVAVCRSVLAELAEAEQNAGPADELEGSISITAPELFGRLKVLPVVEEFLAAHPRVKARVLLLNRIVNLVEEGVDLAVRLAPLPDSSIVAVPLGDVRKLVCAAPSYLDRAPAPKTPHDLQKHHCLGEQEGKARELWQFVDRRTPGKRTLTVAVQPRIALNTAGASIDAAVRGQGICRAISYQVAEHLEDGRLITTLAAFEPEPVPAQLVFHRIPKRNHVLRAFIDFITPRLRTELTSIAARMPPGPSHKTRRKSTR